MKGKYKVMIAYLIYFSWVVLSGLLFGYFLGFSEIKEHHTILYWVLVTIYGFVTFGLPEYIIERIK